MKFDIYGRFLAEVQRRNGAWAVYKIGSGKRSRLNDKVMPPDLEEAEFAGFPDDVFHELSGPGERVEPMK